MDAAKIVVREVAWLRFPSAKLMTIFVFAFDCHEAIRIAIVRIVVFRDLFCFF